jgi:hypothetical protein
MKDEPAVKADSSFVVRPPSVYTVALYEKTRHLSNERLFDLLTNFKDYDNIGAIAFPKPI